jgi:hypothetical protein
LSSPDGGLGTRVDRVKVLSGTMFDPATPGVAVIGPRMAALEHLSPGDTVRVLGVPNGRDGTPDFRQAALLAFRVTGIVVLDTQVVATGSTNTQPTVLVSEPFSRTAQATAFSYGDEAAVRPRPGASMQAFIAAANQVAGRYGTADPPRGTGGKVDAVTLADSASPPPAAAAPPRCA